MSILQALYDSEINGQISTFWDAGFAWKLGDDLNGYKDGGTEGSLGNAADALRKAALHHYPESDFAKEVNKALAGGEAE